MFYERDFECTIRTANESRVVRLQNVRGVMLGRDAELQRKPYGVTINDVHVSHRHAAILVGPDGEVVVRDFDSTNGTFVGTVRVPSKELVALGAAGRFVMAGVEVVVQVLGSTWEGLGSTDEARLGELAKTPTC
jgi:hypothetical protein